MWPDPHETADLFTFTEGILNEKLNFLCSIKACKKKNHCHKLSEKEIAKLLQTQNNLLLRKFWKLVNPLLSDKETYGAYDESVQKEKILQNDSGISEELHEFFKNAVFTSGITTTL